MGWSYQCACGSGPRSPGHAAGLPRTATPRPGASRRDRQQDVGGEQQLTAGIDDRRAGWAPRPSRTAPPEGRLPAPLHGPGSRRLPGRRPTRISSGSPLARRPQPLGGAQQPIGEVRVLGAGSLDLLGDQDERAAIEVRQTDRSIYRRCVEVGDGPPEGRCVRPLSATRKAAVSEAVAAVSIGRAVAIGRALRGLGRGSGAVRSVVRGLASPHGNQRSGSKIGSAEPAMRGAQHPPEDSPEGVDRHDPQRVTPR